MNPACEFACVLSVFFFVFIRKCVLRCDEKMKAILFFGYCVFKIDLYFPNKQKKCFVFELFDNV